MGEGEFLSRLRFSLLWFRRGARQTPQTTDRWMDETQPAPMSLWFSNPRSRDAHHQWLNDAPRQPAIPPTDRMSDASSTLTDITSLSMSTTMASTLDVTSELNASHDVTCLICLDDMAIGAARIKLPKCGHSLWHSHCVRRWLQVCPRCPLCSRTVPFVRRPDESAASDAVMTHRGDRDSDSAHEDDDDDYNSADDNLTGGSDESTTDDGFSNTSEDEASILSSSSPSSSSSSSSSVATAALRDDLMHAGTGTPTPGMMPSASCPPGSGMEPTTTATAATAVGNRDLTWTLSERRMHERTMPNLAAERLSSQEVEWCLYDRRRSRVSRPTRRHRYPRLSTLSSLSNTFSIVRR